MTSAEFIYLCKTFGDQSLPENERWKSIKYIHADGHPLFDIHDLYKQKCCYFIATDEFTGFAIREQTLPEFQIKADPVITFIDANCIFSVTFLDTFGVSSMADIQKILGEDLSITIEFPKTSYEVKTVNEIAFSISDVNADPFVTVKFFETQELANAATSPEDSNALSPIAVSKNIQYYLKAFATSPYSGQSLVIPVTILSDGVNDVTYKFVNDDGTVIKTATVARGTKIQPPSIPIKNSTAQYSYTFTGWDGYTNGMTAEDNVVFTAKYTSTVNKYTYKFLSDDNKTVLKEATVEYGTVITAPENPSKIATAQYTYTFSKWDGYTSGMILTGNITFKAVFTSTIRQYTYTFYDEDGSTVLKSQKSNYGTTITPPTNPTKAPTAQYTYTFKEWSGYVSGTTLTSDITFKAVYTSTINKYTYTFYTMDDSGNKTVVETKNVEYGTVIIAPSAPSKPATPQYTYTFSKWNGYMSGMKITSNVSFEAVFTSTVRQYTYTFYDEDGTTKLKETTVAYGTTITPPTNPTKAPTVQYTYTFSNWSGYTEGMIVTGAVTFKAVYVSTVNKYTYTFYDEDGSTVLKTDTVDYGTTITAPSTPTKSNTAQYTYTFSKWNGYTSGMKITDNVTFKAVYTSSIRQYTYTFYDEDGSTVLKTDTVDYGTVIVPPTEPIKESTAQYTYTFSKWNGYTSGMKITDNVTFKAVYTSSIRKYTYTFYDEDGSTVLKTDTVDYGTIITPPETNPIKEATETATYEFVGYEGFNEGMTITSTIQFIAMYTENPIT